MENKDRYKSMLVIVPHPDDEINIAGSLLYSWIKNGNTAHVCFTSNGDFRISAAARQQEAINALDVLGVPKENVIFLGYADTDKSEGNHTYHCEKRPFVAKKGHSMTHTNDFRYIHSREHSAYVRENYIRDIKDVILSVKPDLIVAIDCDSHMDHRSTSLATEHAIGEILLREEEYHPMVLKTFAYSLYYDGKRDYYESELSDTVMQEECKDLVNWSTYEWSRRRRFVAPVACKTKSARDNILYKALKKHQSQFAVDRVCSIANNDIVYWQRRTDNLALKAKITVSSNEKDGKYLNDFMLYDSAAIYEDILSFSKYLWSPSIGDIIPTVHLEWANKREMQYITLYGPMDENTYEKEIKILSEGQVLSTGTYKFYKGHPVMISLEKRHCCSTLEIAYINNRDDGFGFSEIEIYENDWNYDTINHQLGIPEKDEKTKWKNNCSRLLQKYIDTSYLKVERRVMKLLYKNKK